MGALPRVVVDARMLGPLGHGIAIYIKDMAFGLAKLREKGQLKYDLIFLVHEKINIQVALANFPTFPMKSVFLHPRENWEIPNVLTQLRADLYHSPSFSSLPFCPCPYVQTLHDLNHLHYGSFAKKLYYRFLLKRFAQNASKLITVSESSSSEISAWLGIDPTDIAIVPNAIRFSVTDESRTSLRALQELHIVPQRYFFLLSSMKSHKNLSVVLHAYKKLLRDRPDCPWSLVLPLEKNPLPGVKGVVCTGPLSADQIFQLLKNCGLFLFPSKYEGFGRPPLEAISVGAPLVVSDIPTHREVLEGVPESECKFLPPEEADLWKEAMLAALSGQFIPPSLSTREWVKHTYSVEKLAQSMDRIYNEHIRKFP